MKSGIGFRDSLGDFLTLVKPPIVGLAVWAAAGGLALAPSGSVSLSRAFVIILGSALLIAGAAAFNMVLDRERDAVMIRTRNRPLPAGRISLRAAQSFSLLLVALGSGALWLAANPRTVLLGLAAFILYTLVYTPLKGRSLVSFLAGVIAGSSPALLGWTAATDTFLGDGLWLFALIALWQIPHVQAIARHLKDDYARIGIELLPLKCSDATLANWIRAETLLLSATCFLFGAMKDFGAGYHVLTALASAILLGAAFTSPARERWAFWYFKMSLVFLALVVLGTFLG